LKTIINDALVEKLEEISQNFWISLNQEFFTHFNSMVIGYKQSLIEYYRIDDKEFVPMAEIIEETIYNSLKKEFNKKIREIPGYAMEAFRRKFWYDESIPRTWNKMNEGDIDKLYDRVKKDNAYILNLFKEFKLLKNPLKCITFL
jgi:hypothetical protein